MIDNIKYTVCYLNNLLVNQEYRKRNICWYKNQSIYWYKNQSN